VSSAKRVIRDRFAADGEVFDRGEAAERFEVGLGEGITLHLHLRDHSAGLGDFGTEFLERFDSGEGGHREEEENAEKGFHGSGLTIHPGAF
jgi:hypothetical protein